MKIEITIPNMPSKHWLNAAKAAAKTECQKRGVTVQDADITVNLPERGRQFVSPAGDKFFTAVG